MKEETNFPSAFAIDDNVIFRPMYRHQQKMGIADDDMHGRIVSVKFTKAKVFYSIIDDYFGALFDDVDSIKVQECGRPYIPVISEN